MLTKQFGNYVVVICTFVMLRGRFHSTGRRGATPLPRYIRYGSVAFFSFCGAYVGFLSGGPFYARRILSVPNSQLAEDLRIAVGDWQARVPQTPVVDLEEVNQKPDPMLSSGSQTKASANTLTGQNGKRKKSSSKSVAYWLGLTKS